MGSHDAIRRQFGAAAPRYAAAAVLAGGPDLDALVAAAGVGGSGRVLDVACGAGHTALAFASRAAEVVGVDLTEPMLEQARALAERRGVANARFEPGDAAALPFPDASFDLVATRYGAHHFARPDEAVREAARVLRPAGAFLLLDLVAPEEPALDTFLNTVERLRDPTHVRDHRVSDWLRMLAAAGLRAEVVHAAWLDLDFADWTERAGTPEVSVAALRALFAGAPDEARAAFTLTEESFRIPIAVLRGDLPPR